MKLVKPSLNMEKEYWNFINEFVEKNEKFIPSAIAPIGKSYQKWLEKNFKISNENTCSKNLVPSHLYFLQSDLKKIIGAVDIRIKLNDYLLKYGGHIGYGIVPSERRKGYGIKILKLALEISIQMGINKILITCDKKNLGSSKIIEINAGVLENEIYNNENEIIKRYWVKAKDTI